VRNQPTPIRVIQTDFRGGEVSPNLAMRVDTKIYPSGASSLRNSLLSNSGAVSRRPGMTVIAQLEGERILVAFEYDADEKYILAFGIDELEIYDAEGTLVDSFGAAKCPWGTWNVVTNLTVAQRADVMVICHRSFRPKVLKRTSLTTFTLEDFEFDAAPNNAEIYQPYVKHEAADVTIAPSSTSVGAVTLTASDPIFSADWVGDTIRIYGAEITITGYTSTTVVSGTAKKKLEKKLDPNPFFYTGGTALIEVTDALHGLATGDTVTFAGAIDGYAVSKGNINGSRTITVTDEDHYTFVAGGGDIAGDSADWGGSAVTVSSTAATRAWDEQTFSDRRGWPRAVCWHEDRLWFGGSTSIPDGLWSSCTGDYYNFEVGDGEDDRSVQVSIGGSRISTIKHLLSNRVLQIFTEGMEYVAKQSDGVGLTPATTSIRPQTPYGASAVWPKIFDGATIFVQANSKTIRDYLYEYSQDSFQAPDLLVVSPHLVNTVADMAVVYGSSTRTEQYAFIVNGDGTAACFHSVRAEGLAAWVPWDTRDGDSFESVVALSDKVFFAVNRDGTRWLERLEVDDDTVPLDFAISLTAGAPTASWALGADYAGKTVHVVSENWYLGEYVVDGSGNMGLDYSVSSIVAGYHYQWEVTPLPPDTQMQDGPMTGETRRVSSVTVHVADCYSLAINGKDVIVPQAGFDPSEPPVALTGKYRRYLLGYGRDPAVRFTQSAPLPATILGCVMEISG
jgi:hypothetical protein